MRAALVSLTLLVVGAGVAHGDPCQGGTPARPFKACFDPGDRLALDSGAGGAGDVAAGATVGGVLALRHFVETDEPSVTWRFEHEITRVGWDGEALGGTAYRAFYMRHSIDGTLMLPTSPPRRLSFPFDVGTTLDVGTARYLADDETLALGVIRGAPVLELTRSPDFRRRLTIGPRIRWDLRMDVPERLVTEQLVAPFTEGELALHLETAEGRTSLDARIFGGTVWSSTRDWLTVVGGEAELERVLIGLNDQPISVFARVAWVGGDEGASAADEPLGLSWGIGLRLGVAAAR